MISANAILIGAVSSKHDSMSNRMRMMTAEFRQSGTTPGRRDSIRTQVGLFRKRLRYVATAHILLYAAAACFIAMVLVIALTPFLQTWSTVSLPLMVSGVSLMFVSIILELIELRASQTTIAIECGDVQ